MSDRIRQETDDGVAWVRMCRPDVRNAFDERMIAELTACFSALTGADGVRAVVLSGEGKSFCAGADLAWMQKMVRYSFDENLADARALSLMLRSIADCPKPVIARVHGAAFGGGVGLVAACDLACALKRATFCLSEVKLGIAPAVIAPFLIEKISMSAARRYALTAERFDAAEARRIGLVHDVAATEQAMDAAIKEHIERFMRAGPQALAATKSILTEASRFSRDAALERMAEHIARLRASDEGQEGLKAFLEKRSARWIASRVDDRGG